MNKQPIQYVYPISVSICKFNKKKKKKTHCAYTQKISRVARKTHKK